MCGIAGYAGFTPPPGLLARMTAALRHRGPDDAGAIERPGVGLGMRRLSIIDVAGGHQPLHDESGALALVLNGEIYNYRALARDLSARGHRLATRSDAETVLHLYEEEGIAGLRHLRGMFGLALHDARRDELFVARDRLGIKPIYYWERGGRLLFASEIKALFAHPEVAREPHLPSLDAYLRLRYSPGPATMFAGIRKLPPGHWLSFRDGRVKVERWWTPSARPAAGDGREIEARFAASFAETVELHLASDVPVGAFLSGGLDSSLVVAQAIERGAGRMHTFAAGFGWAGDETPAAREVATALGCEHHEVACGPETLALLPRIVWHSDEPLGDPITLPVYRLAEEARRHVKVVLTGEGADEVLAGYLFHRVLDLTHTLRGAVPGALLDRVAAPLVRRLPVRLLDRFFDYPAGLGERGRRKLATYLEVAATDDAGTMYEALISLFDRDELTRLAGGAPRPLPVGPGAGGGEAGGDFLSRALGLQFATWLPDNILARQDRMSMAHGVESRVPFLDHLLVEELLGVPSHLKLRALRGANKILARRAARRLLPPAVAGRRKKAFYIPAEGFLATRAWSELVRDTLDRAALERRGYFDPAAVATLVRFANERREFVAVRQVLSLVMLELWHRLFIDQPPPLEAPA